MAQDYDYYPVAIDASRLDPKRMHRFALGEGEDDPQAIAICVRGKWKFFRDQCPHMGGPLSEGKLLRSRCRLKCMWHGYEFDLEAEELVENPNDRRFACMSGLYPSYRPEKRPRFRLIKLKAVEINGLIRVKK